MTNNNEKRNSLRMPIDCHLRYSVVGDDRDFEGTVINLSDKGILFTSRQKLEVGSLLTLVLTASQTKTPPMHATVKVTRVISKRVQYEVACIIRTKFD
jgi:hypothetical protein